MLSLALFFTKDSHPWIISTAWTVFNYCHLLPHILVSTKQYLQLIVCHLDGGHGCVGSFASRRQCNVFSCVVLQAQSLQREKPITRYMQGHMPHNIQSRLRESMRLNKRCRVRGTQCSLAQHYNDIWSLTWWPKITMHVWSSHRILFRASWWNWFLRKAVTYWYTVWEAHTCIQLIKSHFISLNAF